LLPGAFQALRPGAGDVDPGGLLRISGVARPAREAAVGVGLIGDGPARGEAGVLGERSVELPLLIVGAAGDRVL